MVSLNVFTNLFATTFLKFQSSVKNEEMSSRNFLYEKKNYFAKDYYHTIRKCKENSSATQKTAGSKNVEM